MWVGGYFHPLPPANENTASNFEIHNKTSDLVSIQTSTFWNETCKKPHFLTKNWQPILTQTNDLSHCVSWTGSHPMMKRVSTNLYWLSGPGQECHNHHSPLRKVRIGFWKCLWDKVSKLVNYKDFTKWKHTPRKRLCISHYTPNLIMKKLQHCHQKSCIASFWGNWVNSTRLPKQNAYAWKEALYFTLGKMQTVSF